MAEKTLIPDIVNKQNLVILTEQTTILAAAEIMARRNIGAVIIGDRGRLVGIFTERDLLTRVAVNGVDMATTPLSQVMSRYPISLPPGASVREALKIMQRHNFRHLPVVEDHTVVGIVSIRDLTEALNAELEEKIERYESMFFSLRD